MIQAVSTVRPSPGGSRFRGEEPNRQRTYCEAQLRQMLEQPEYMGKALDYFEHPETVLSERLPEQATVPPDILERLRVAFSAPLAFVRGLLPTREAVLADPAQMATKTDELMGLVAEMERNIPPIVAALPRVGVSAVSTEVPKEEG